MIHAFQQDYGVDVLHAWGMTEMSPLGTLCTLKNKHLALPAEEQMKIRLPVLDREVGYDEVAARV